MKEKTVCFSGHRRLTAEEIPLIEKELELTLSALIREGFTRFIAGGALGFDCLSALAVLKQRELGERVSLLIAVPHIGQEDNWSKENKAKYEEILRRADEVVILSEDYYRGCMQARNRYMVDNSSVCVAFLKNPSGGTAYTVSYAKKSGVRVINFAENQIELPF